MGTNFYYKTPLKKRDKHILHKIINTLPESDIYDLKEKLNEIEQRMSIHLGKRSYGWQFLWDYHNGNYYDASLKSIKKYLNDRNGWIQNEYDEKFTIEEFFEEIKDSLYKNEKHCDAYQYYQNHPEEPLYYNINEHEFQSKDGLRFSYDENFG